MISGSSVLAEPTAPHSVYDMETSINMVAEQEVSSNQARAPPIPSEWDVPRTRTARFDRKVLPDGKIPGFSRLSLCISAWVEVVLEPL